MAVRDSLSDLVQELPHRALIKLVSRFLFLLDHRLQVTAFCVVHHDVEDGVFLKESTKGDDEVTLEGLKLGCLSYG